MESNEHYLITVIPASCNLSSFKLAELINSRSMVQQGVVHFVHLDLRIFQKQTDTNAMTPPHIAKISIMNDYTYTYTIAKYLKKKQLQQ